MHTHETANELVIQETPGCLWFIGGFFAIIGGLFVYGAIGSFTNWNSTPLWQLGLTFFMSFAGVSTGIWLIHKSPISKIVIDRIQDTVTLTRLGAFGRSKYVYSFDDIQEFCLVEDIDDEGSSIWDFGMLLNEGEIIKITSLATHSEHYHRNFVFASNDFARKTLPMINLIPEFEDNARDEEFS